jgi:hypothetical protein
LNADAEWSAPGDDCGSSDILSARSGYKAEPLLKLGQ